MAVQISNILQKIQRLKHIQPVMLFQYVCLTKPVSAGVFRLSDIRLCALQCGNGAVRLHQAAPVVQTGADHMPHIKYTQNCVYKIIQGDNKGILVQRISYSQQEQQTKAAYVQAAHVGVQQISKSTPVGVLNRVAAIARTPYLPVSQIIQPAYIRIARQAGSLRLRLTQQHLCQVHGDIQRARQQICSKMSDGSTMAPFDHVYSGGLCCAAAPIVNRQAIYNLFGMPVSQFRTQALARNWEICKGDS